MYERHVALISCGKCGQSIFGLVMVYSKCRSDGSSGERGPKKVFVMTFGALLFLGMVCVGVISAVGVNSSPDRVLKTEVSEEPTSSGLIKKSEDRGLEREIFGALCEVREVDGELRCDRCPAGFSGEAPLKLETAYVGNFVKEGLRYAILGVEGCDEGWNFRRGTVLLQEEGLSWRVIETSAEVNTSKCEPFSFAEQHVLICRDIEAGQGRVRTDVNAVWVDDGKLKEAPLFSIEDRSGTCNFVGEFSMTLDGLVAADVMGDGEEELLALLTVKKGYYLSEPDGGDRCDDVEEGRVVVSEQQRRHVFDWSFGAPVEFLWSEDRIPAAVYEQYFVDLEWTAGDGR